jgi:hypothetical protein
VSGFIHVDDYRIRSGYLHFQYINLCWILAKNCTDNSVALKLQVGKEQNQCAYLRLVWLGSINNRCYMAYSGSNVLRRDHQGTFAGTTCPWLGENKVKEALALQL